MGRMQPRWVADDGTEFDSESEMILHELALIDEKEIELFLKAHMESSSKKHKEYARIILQWQSYRRQQELQESADILDPLA